MRIKNLELWLALFTIAAITGLYLLVIAIAGVPAAGEFWGHTLGVVGFLMMLMTETLYSIRKHNRQARWGKMSNWLSFHIFTGLVGPYMVLLHTAWQFNGLAGILTLLTVIIVASGFVGRYFYTAIPRTPEGVEIEVEQINQMISDIQSELDTWRKTQPHLAAQLEPVFSGTSKTPGTTFDGWGTRRQSKRQWKKVKKQINKSQQPQIQQLTELWERSSYLKKKASSLALTRRFLAIWHLVHIPIGVALFTVAFIHIGAALYYSTFLH